MEYVKNKPFITNEKVLNVDDYKGYTMVLAQSKKFTKGLDRAKNFTNGYVVIKPNQKGYNTNINKIICHGGINFDKHDDNKNRVIGFDTAYDDDFTSVGLIEAWNSKKWTTSKLFEECKKIINQLTEEA